MLKFVRFGQWTSWGKTYYTCTWKPVQIILFFQNKVPTTNLENFRTLKLSNLESFKPPIWHRELYEACKYIALTSSEQECRMGPLRRILPRRRHSPGSRPGITGEDPMSKDQDQWDFPSFWNGLTEHEKKLVLAKVMKTSVIAIFKTHIFIWWKMLPPVDGGPIGLSVFRSTCCIVRL